MQCETCEHVVGVIWRPTGDDKRPWQCAPCTFGISYSRDQRELSRDFRRPTMVPMVTP